MALDLKYSKSANLEACLRASGVEYIKNGTEFRLLNAHLSGNTFLNFVPA